MSTAADVIRAVEALVSDVDELLESATLEVVIELVDAIGGGDAMADLFSELSELLSGARAELERLLAAIRDPLRHARALGGLLGLLEPLMGGLERVLALSGEQLADAGLDGVLTVSEPLADAVRFGGDVLAAGGEILASLPSEEDLQRLRDGFDGLIETVDEYAAGTRRSAA